MNNLVKIGQSLKEKRLSLNLTMDAVANKANITRATLWAIENGKGNYSINSLLSVMNVLSLDMVVNNQIKSKPLRERASRINTLLDKKINRFIIMCVEQYCLEYDKESSKIYDQMKKMNVLNELKNDYEDLHGMSTTYLNSYIHSLLGEQ